MKFRTREQHREITQQYPYYRHRWKYFKLAIEILQGKEFQSVFELGPGPCGKSIIHGADTMWHRELPVKPTYSHDATVLPWPIADQQYDLFIALQVFEHLGREQWAVFHEVRRIAKSALLSFPYKWGIPGTPHHVTYDMIRDWTGGLNISEALWTPDKRHLLLFYEFTT